MRYMLKKTSTQVYTHTRGPRSGRSQKSMRQRSTSFLKSPSTTLLRRKQLKMNEARDTKEAHTVCRLLTSPHMRSNACCKPCIRQVLLCRLTLTAGGMQTANMICALMPVSAALAHLNLNTSEWSLLQGACQSCRSTSLHIAK